MTIANDLCVNLDVSRTTMTETSVCVYIAVDHTTDKQERAWTSSAFHASLLDVLGTHVAIQVHVCDESPYLLFDSLSALYRHVIALYPWRFKAIMESLVETRVLQSIQNVQRGTNDMLIRYGNVDAILPPLSCILNNQEQRELLVEFFHRTNTLPFSRFDLFRTMLDVPFTSEVADKVYKYVFLPR